VDDDLAACTVLDGPLPPQGGVRYVIGLDVGTVNDRTAAVIAHAEPVTRTLADGEVTSGVRVILDRLQVWAGSRARPVQLAEVGDWLDLAAGEYNHAAVVFDPFQAVELTQRLSKRGVSVEQFNFTAASVGRLALTLYQLLRARSLALPNDSALLDELANVRLRETSPGTYRLDHDPDRHDDRAIALALAAHELVERSGRHSAAGIAGVFYHDRRLAQELTVEDQLAAYHAAKERRRRIGEAERRREAAAYRDPRTCS
jgi:phage terminase large subunit-like protein